MMSNNVARGLAPGASNRKNYNIFEVAQNNDLEQLLDCYLEKVDFTTVDKDGNTILHLAAQGGNRAMVRAIIGLSINDQLWTKKNKQGKTPADVADPKVRNDIALMSMKNPTIPTHHSEYNKMLINQRLEHPNPNYKVLLSIDGGGVRAILMLTLMLAIEKELQEPIMQRCHWLAGTSSGGIISLLLGVGMSCDRARRLFFGARNETFCGNTKLFPKHNSSGIETSLKRNYGEHTTMGDIKTHNIMITTAKVKAAPPTLVLWRTYAPRMTVKECENHGYLNPNRLLIWKCARTTSAAPVYFESFHDHADGAIFCNNPCIQLMTDFMRLKKLENYKGIENTDEIGCVISIGSGIEPVTALEGGIDINLKHKANVRKYMDVFGKGMNLISMFMYQCTASNLVSVGQAREWAHSIGVPFFRFSPRLSQSFELDNINLEGIFDFVYEAEVYLHTQVKHEIQELVRVLKSMPKNTQQVYENTVL